MISSGIWYILIVMILPLLVMCVFTLWRSPNKPLIITALLVTAVYLCNMGVLVLTENMLYYFLGCFVVMIIATVGWHYGYARYQSFVDRDALHRHLLGMFALFFTVVLFPILPAIFLMKASNDMHKAPPEVKVTKPELSGAPSWKEVAKEKEKEEG